MGQGRMNSTAIDRTHIVAGHRIGIFLFELSIVGVFPVFYRVALLTTYSNLARFCNGCSSE